MRSNKTKQRTRNSHRPFFQPFPLPNNVSSQILPRFIEALLLVPSHSKFNSKSFHSIPETFRVQSQFVGFAPSFIPNRIIFIEGPSEVLPRSSLSRCIPVLIQNFTLHSPNPNNWDRSRMKLRRIKLTGIELCDES